MKNFISRIKSKKAESTSVGVMMSILPFVLFLVIFLSIFAWYIQYISLAGFTDGCMEIAAYSGKYTEIQEEIEALAEQKGYEVVITSSDDMTTVPVAQGKKVYVSINSPSFTTIGGDQVVQYGDEIGVSVSKRAIITFYNKGNSRSIFNINCRKTGISQQYFKEVV